MSLFNFSWWPWKKPPEEPVLEITDEGFTWKSATGETLIGTDLADIETKAVAQAIEDGELLAPGEGVGVNITPMESVGRGTGEETLVPRKPDGDGA